MVKASALLSFVLVLLAFSGCCKDVSNQDRLEGQAAKGVFPEVMVGIWEADFGGGHKWGIKFESDGSIQKIIHSVIGPVRLAEGGIYEEGPELGTYCVFAMGPCQAEYMPSGETLKVQIVVDYFKMQFPSGELEGRMEDYFEGPVSEDGESWNVEWRNYSWLEGANPPPIDIIDANPEKLVFTKIDINDIEDVNDVNDAK